MPAWTRVKQFVDRHWPTERPSYQTATNKSWFYRYVSIIRWSPDRHYSCIREPLVLILVGIFVVAGIGFHPTLPLASGHLNLPHEISNIANATRYLFFLPDVMLPRHALLTNFTHPMDFWYPPVFAFDVAVSAKLDTLGEVLTNIGAIIGAPLLHIMHYLVHPSLHVTPNLAAIQTSYSFFVMCWYASYMAIAPLLITEVLCVVWHILFTTTRYFNKIDATYFRLIRTRQRRHQQINDPPLHHNEQVNWRLTTPQPSPLVRSLARLRTLGMIGQREQRA